ncbi:MAG TPA: response regulator, partial [Verrucomicrobiae bacterium]|nr:response regulator [Verrucomicrobiae bacterium]
VHEKAPQTVRDNLPQDKPTQSLRVLCIDDDGPIRQLLEDCLTGFKHRVVTASSGEQGIELFRAARRKNEPFEAVITDLGMPRMDGYQVARIIKAESSRMPIIMMTGWGSMMKEDGETAPEVDAMVGKPPDIQRLNDLLLRVTQS